MITSFTIVLLSVFAPLHEGPPSVLGGCSILEPCTCCDAYGTSLNIKCPPGVTCTPDFYWGDPVNRLVHVETGGYPSQNYVPDYVSLHSICTYYEPCCLAEGGCGLSEDLTFRVCPIFAQLSGPECD
jgi:hypothetical protein